MLSPEQEQKLIRVAKVMDDGYIAILKEIDELKAEIKAFSPVLPEKAEKGDKGDRGERGEKGNDGRDGRDGVDGKDGIDGKDGEMGVIDEATIAYLENEIKELEKSLKEVRSKYTRDGIGVVIRGITAGSGVTVDSSNMEYPVVSSLGGTTDWGDIGGTLSDQTDLQTALDGKSNTGHTHTTGDITGIQEYVEDTIGTKLIQGTNVTISYNDTTGETTVSAAGASVNIKQTEVDFGATPVSEGTFTIVDADVSAGSQIIAQLSYEAPTGKDLDEVEMDSLAIVCQPASGQFSMRISATDYSYLADKFKINYLVG